MTLSQFFFLVAFGMLALLLFSAAVLYASCRIARISGTTWKRAFGATAFITIVSLLCGVLAFLVDFALDFAYPYAAHVIYIALFLVGTFLSICWIFRANAGRAVVALLLWLLPQYVAWNPAVWLFRRHCLEAFHIPTGNMAPTILGERWEGICAECDTLHRFGLPTLSDRLFLTSLNCPNCRAEFGDESLFYGEGDKIVVDKINTPARWDMIAFTDPGNLEIYLQRLVGLPGETVVIEHGDVFVNGERLVKAPGVAEEMWIEVHDTRDADANEAEPSDTNTAPAWTPSPRPSAWKREAFGWSFRGLERKDTAFDLVFKRPLDSRIDFSPASPGSRADFEPDGDFRIDVSIDRFEGGGRLDVNWSYGGSMLRVSLSTNGRIEREIDGNVAPVRASGSTSPSLSVYVRDGMGFIVLGESVEDVFPVYPEKLDAARTRWSSPPSRGKLTLRAANCDIDLSRIVVSRDLHYLNSPGTVASMKLAGNECFVLGDNSAWSADSRYPLPLHATLTGKCQPGAVPVDFVRGPVRAIVWPPERWRFFHPHAE